MKKYISLLLFIVTANILFGQTPITPPVQVANGDRLNLVSSTGGIIMPNKSHTTIFNPVYEHKGNTLAADSGYLYENQIKQQFFEAFGNVVITQPSGTVIYADKLHYDATAQHARLTGNVKMVDKNSTLTTNYLTYNMRSKIGTYTGGGRIVSQTDTITSKNAYYFENTGDAYFRHKVVVRNPSVKVYTDTMRYNGATKNTYFFGPTNIKGNNKENLYTEKGVYNTATGVANFSKKNLYTEGSRFLKGDSLYFEKISGIGKAYKNVVFVDTTDKFFAYGNKGVYTKSEESILMTEKPYIVTVVKKDTDTTQTDSARVNSDLKLDTKNKEVKKDKKPEIKPKNSSKVDKNKEIEQPSILTEEDKKIKPAEFDSVYTTADTLYSRMILAKDYIALNLNLSRDGGQLEEDTDEDYGDDEFSQDTLSAELPVITEIAEKKDIVSTADNKNVIKKDNNTTKKSPKKTASNSTIPKTPIGLHEDRKQIANTIKADSVLRQTAIVPKLNEADSIISEALKVAQNTDTIKKADTTTTNNAISDTARTRIVKAYYNVRLYKSDLQAVADSVYYGMQDSMFRFMGRPMIWSQGSQISADTIYMQILNQKMDNALLKENAFMVNAVLDTVKFNQLKGRKITAFFANNNIDRLYVDGNAENLVFVTNDKTKVITEMFHNRGARFKVKMKGKEITDYITIRKVDQKVYPFVLVTQENEILQGFKWRPQDRPTSKEDLLNRKRELPKDEDQKTENVTDKKETEDKVSYK